MTARDRDTLKTYFETGDIPEEVQFADFIDSVHNTVDDGTVGVTTGEAFVSTEVKVDAEGSLLLQPTPATNTRKAIRIKWDNPATGAFINPVQVEALAANSVNGENQPIPEFKLDLNLTEFGATVDHPFSIGYHGDYLTTDTCYWVQEVGYDTASAATLGGAFRSNERYDVVHHVTHDGTPNPHWGDAAIRCGFCYSTYAYGTESSPTMIGIVVLDQVSYSSAYPNPNGTHTGAFGQYFATGANLINRSGYATVSARGATNSVTIQAQLTGSPNRIASTNPLSMVVDAGSSSTYGVELGGLQSLALGKTGATVRLENPDSPATFTIQSTDNHNNASVDFYLKNTTSGVWLWTGVASPTFDFSYANYANRAKLVSYLGSGIIIGTHDVNQITFFQGTNGEIAKFDTSGNLVLRPNASVTPAANGDMVFEATSNTSLKIKYKGSDGTVRSTTLTLS